MLVILYFFRWFGTKKALLITLVRNDKGIWKAVEFSSLVVGIKAPKQKSKGAAE